MSNISIYIYNIYIYVGPFLIWDRRPGRNYTRKKTSLKTWRTKSCIGVSFLPFVWPCHLPVRMEMNGSWHTIFSKSLSRSERAAFMQNRNHWNIYWASGWFQCLGGYAVLCLQGVQCRSCFSKQPRAKRRSRWLFSMWKRTSCRGLGISSRALPGRVVRSGTWPSQDALILVTVFAFDSIDSKKLMRATSTGHSLEKWSASFAAVELWWDPEWKVENFHQCPFRQVFLVSKASRPSKTRKPQCPVGLTKSFPLRRLQRISCKLLAMICTRGSEDPVASRCKFQVQLFLDCWCSCNLQVVGACPKYRHCGTLCSSLLKVTFWSFEPRIETHAKRHLPVKRTKDV